MIVTRSKSTERAEYIDDEKILDAEDPGDSRASEIVAHGEDDAEALDPEGSDGADEEPREASST